MQLFMVLLNLIVTLTAQQQGIIWKFARDPYGGEPFNYVQYFPDRIPTYESYDVKPYLHTKPSKEAHTLISVKEHSTLAPFIEPIPEASLKEQHILDIFNDGSVVCPSQNGMFYVAGMCNVFFVCTDGKPEFLHCSNGMEFNSDIQLCDLPQRAACDIQCPEYNGTTGIPGKCNQFIDCTNGNSQVVSCPDGLHYSQLFHSCLPPKIARCEFSCPEKYGFYPIPGYCEEYIKCKDGEIIYQRCPAGLHFNSKLKMCDIPERTTCVHNCPHPDGIFPVEGDCSLFIMCINNVPEVGFCNDGYCFNFFTNKCEPLEAVELRHQCPSPNGRFALPENRTEMFIECVNNSMSIKICPPSLEYNDITENCDSRNMIQTPLPKNGTI